MQGVVEQKVEMADQQNITMLKAVEIRIYKMIELESGYVFMLQNMISSKTQKNSTCKYLKASNLECLIDLFHLLALTITLSQTLVQPKACIKLFYLQPVIETLSRHTRYV